ncbi:MAG: TIGR04013 family B12-binding domain/radical SAM domain-containing protein [Methanothrix sp.]|nr:TIGR04013 family B12-binding domain/radical SAM domain-containing protein [Methanothrix sp.]
MRPDIWFRWYSRNSYSIAALLPLVEAELTLQPRPGIMLYSFATAQAPEVYREVSDARVDAVFIAGGPHPSALPEEATEHFDFVVVGEGEEALPELIDAILEGRDPSGVRGIAYRRGGAFRFTGSRDPVDLDSYPPFGRVLAPIEISRGCPWGCAYCQTPRLFGRSMRHRSVQRIVEHAHRHRDIRLTSPNALAYGSDGISQRIDRVKRLLEGLSELGRPIYFGTFPSEVRPEFVTDQALDLISEHCANRSLAIGGQSGSPAILRRIGRGHGPQEIEAACELCWEHGIIPQVDLIFGLPGESAEDQHLTLEMARWIVSRGGRVRAHPFTPLPGTPLASERPAPLADDVEAELGRLALGGRLSGRWSARGRTA